MCHPISDLDRIRRAVVGAFGVGAGSVSADDLHARMGAEPGGQCLGGAVGEHVDRAV
jgi:hypothetical protein